MAAVLSGVVKGVRSANPGGQIYAPWVGQMFSGQKFLICVTSLNSPGLSMVTKTGISNMIIQGKVVPVEGSELNLEC